MFFACELKKLRNLKAALLSRFRCETIIKNFPDYLQYRLDTCPEAAALKAAEEKLENEKKIDAANRKKRVRTATIVTLIISVLAALAVAIFVFAADPVVIAISVAAALVVTLIVRLISKACIKKSRAKNYDALLAAEEELKYGQADYEVAKNEIEEKLQRVLAFYENRLNNPCDGLNAIIQRATIVHDEDKDYNTVCQLIWCFEHKYAGSVKEAKQWIARANHSKYVRGRLNELKFGAKDDADIDIDATEGKDYSEEIPVSVED